MQMQTIRLDVSSDIYDKVLFILENLPKNKVKLFLENRENIQSKKDNLIDFFQKSPLKDTISLERDQEIYQERIKF